MDSQKARTFGTVVVLLQGVVTALYPQASVRLTKRMIGKNFDNAADLEANPEYTRRLRALGVGMVAAAGTDLLLQSTGGTEPELSDTEESEPDDE